MRFIQNFRYWWRRRSLPDAATVRTRETVHLARMTRANAERKLDRATAAVRGTGKTEGGVDALQRTDWLEAIRNRATSGPFPVLGDDYRPWRDRGSP